MASISDFFKTATADKLAPKSQPLGYAPGPVANAEPEKSSAFFNGLTGLLSKAADTAIDVWALQERGKVIGSVYPTGQSNPAAVASAATNPTPSTATAGAPIDPKLIYIGAGVVGLIVLVVALKK